MHTTLEVRDLIAGFQPFSADRLLKTVFAPKRGERIAILTDLPDTKKMKNFEFLDGHPDNESRWQLYHRFFARLHDGGLTRLSLVGGEMFAYRQTGGSNLNFLDDVAVNEYGHVVSLKDDVFKEYDIILCGGKYSATAPLTAEAKKYGFRGATMHGLNSVIVNSGLSVDYEQVSATAEKMRLGLTDADYAEIDFECLGEKYSLHIGLGQQEAQKSHGLCRSGPDIANLPAGEIYFVPTPDTYGGYPHEYEDGTIGLCYVEGGKISRVKLLRGNQETVNAHQRKLDADPMTGVLGELGLGTQVLPVSGSDIQDEKILGTTHVATGRSDHLGGSLTPELFVDRLNATHDDYLFSPQSTPETNLTQMRMSRHGQMVVVIENYQPSEYVLDLRK